jgi:biopolymer transport protein ExbD
MRVIDNEVDEPMMINVVPMVDIIFAILSFFVVSTLFLTKAEGFPVNLPQAETSKQQGKADITVTIQESGKIFVGKEPVALNRLTKEIQAQVGPNREALVTIQADEKIEYGRVIAVMDKLRKVEGANLGMATKQPN